jgi:pyruvate dehydrogenase E1 component beta subunit
MVTLALEAAEKLAQEGISAEVLDLRTVSPMDEAAILGSVEKTGRALIAQETYRHCSVATDVAALIAERGFDFLDASVRLVTAKDVPVPFAPVLEKFVLPSVDDIVAAARDLLNEGA